MTLRTLSQTDLRDLLLSVGTHRERRKLTPLQVAHLLSREVATGTTRGTIAKALRVNPSQVGSFLKLSHLHPPIARKATWGRTTSDAIGFSSLAELHPLTKAPFSPNDQTSVADAIQLHRFTRAEVQAIVQTARRSRKPLHDCIEETLRRRPTVSTTRVLLGTILSEETVGLVEDVLFCTHQHTYPRRASRYI